jgi:hypothetical protein
VEVLNRLVLCPSTIHWNETINLRAYLKGIVAGRIVLGGRGRSMVVEFAGVSLENGSASEIPVCEGAVFWDQSVIFWVSDQRTIRKLSTVGAKGFVLLDVPKEVIFAQGLAAG